MRQMRWERSAPMCQIDEISAEEESSAEKFFGKNSIYCGQNGHDTQGVRRQEKM